MLDHQVTGVHAYKRKRSGGMIVDYFAGGGGASHGIERATGYSPNYAINHDDVALMMHKANHQNTIHLHEDVWKVDPKKICRGREVDLAWFSPDCFPAGTMILTVDGYAPIEEISVGDIVFTHKGRWKKVTDTMTSNRTLVTVKGRGHPGLMVSPEHTFYCRERSDTWNNEDRHYEKSLGEPDWPTASMLGKGWYWASPISFPEMGIPIIPEVAGRSFDVDGRMMWLAGRYVADGWARLTKDRAELVITCGNHKVDDLRKNIDVWPRSGLRCGSNEIEWHSRYTETAAQFSTNSRGIVTWLRDQFGHGAAEKLIPGWLLGASRYLRESFLEGYVSGDGYVSSTTGNDLIETSTVSKALAFGIKALAGSLGFSPCVYYNDNPTDVIEGRKVNARPIWSVRWRISVDSKHVQTIRENNMEWSRVCSSEPLTDTCSQVFNISVEDDESYVAEGVVVHNCKHFSKAKGGKPVSNKVRGLAWVVIRFAASVRPKVIILENVEEFKTWGPLLVDGTPCPKRKGKTFAAWTAKLRRYGYDVEFRELRACDYGAPTIRKRLFVIARCDGMPIMWPDPTHGPGLTPYKTAADCIDWTIPCRSIFDRKKPLADNTLRRIANGVMRYTVNSPDPFIVPGDIDTSIIKSSPVSAFLAKNYTGVTGVPMTGSVGTITTWDHHSLVTSQLTKFYGTSADGVSVDNPMPTITSGGQHVAEVRAFLVKYFGTATAKPLNKPLDTMTTKARFGLVTVKGVDYKIVDIGMRMLTPRELFRAQGFHEGYVIDPDINGRPMSKTAQIKMCGNSVCPPIAEAIVAANCKIRKTGHHESNYRA